MSVESETVRRYRLRGEVGGAQRCFPLDSRESRVGSISDNDVVLPVRGVSRRHARLTCGHDGVVIEDLDSRNGILVNGVRTRSARLSAGDEIGLGPVVLRLEEVDAQDVDLAIAVIPEGRTSEGLPSGETTAVDRRALGGRGGAWLRLVEGLLERLCVLPEGDVDGALALLVRELHATGGGLVECGTDSDPVVLAASGELPDLTAHPAFMEFLDGACEARGPAVSALLDDASPALACATAGGPRAGRLAVVVWGDFPGRAESEPLLRATLRLLERLRPAPLEPLARRPALTRGLVFPVGWVHGESAAMASLYGQMRPLLHGDLPVLVVGETGVGKEYVARILHGSSARAKGPFVAVNCAAIPSELLEAEMFGIGKGVATGVVERPGKFRLAEGGTLFLDEIGDMPLDLQAKLLRALQEKEIQPVGSAPIAVNIRVVAATNTDLQRRMHDGRFRRDLYYRLAGYVLSVPPLRERKEDLATLVEGFLRTFARETGRSVRGITVKALRALGDHDWPGNVRELEHEVRRLVYLCPDGGAIDSAMISPHVVASVSAAEPADAPPDPGTSLDLEAQVQKVEERLIRQALVRAGGNRTVAAKLLGISRNGLAIKMQRLGIVG